MAAHVGQFMALYGGCRGFQYYCSQFHEMRIMSKSYIVIPAGSKPESSPALSAIKGTGCRINDLRHDEGERLPYGRFANRPYRKKFGDNPEMKTWSKEHGMV
jgi:hypothetical protein